MAEHLKPESREGHWYIEILDSSPIPEFRVPIVKKARHRIFTYLVLKGSLQYDGNEFSHWFLKESKQIML